MNFVIVDSRLPRDCCKKLSDMGFELIKMPTWEKLDAPVSAHPDMLFFIAGDKIFTHRDYRVTAHSEFAKISKRGYDIIITDEEISAKYPNDVRFNCVQFGNIIYGKRKSTSRLIVEHADHNGLSFCDVKQGYTKCSVCKINDGAAITSDKSLYNALTKNGVDVLLISPSHITLVGYDCGFIGGCTGTTDSSVYFSGNISLHPDGEKIRDFCLKHRKTPVSLSDSVLFDCGTMFFIN